MLVVTLILSLSMPAFAQDGGHVLDDRVETAGDVADLDRLTAAVHAWKAAVGRSDRAGEVAADADLEAWVRRELAEDDREVVESRAELGDARRESRGRGFGDEVDRVDDRQDTEAALADRRRMRVIAGLLRDMQPAFAAGSASTEQYAAKRTLLEELEGLAAREIARSHTEVREDRVERGEVHRR